MLIRVPGIKLGGIQVIVARRFVEFYIPGFFACNIYHNLSRVYCQYPIVYMIWVAVGRFNR